MPSAVRSLSGAVDSLASRFPERSTRPMKGTDVTPTAVPCIAGTILRIASDDGHENRAHPMIPRRLLRGAIPNAEDRAPFDANPRAH